MTRSVVILSGRIGVGLRPDELAASDPLLDIGGKPFAVRHVELLRRHGLTDIIFLLAQSDRQVSETLGDGAAWDVRLRYALDDAHPLGGGGTLRRTLPDLTDPFFVLYADFQLEYPFAGIEEAFWRSGKPALLTVCRTAQRHNRLGVLLIDGIIAYYERQGRILERFRVDAGLAIFRKSAFADFVEDRHVGLADIYRALIAKGDLAGFEVTDRVHEVGWLAGNGQTRPTSP